VNHVGTLMIHRLGRGRWHLDGRSYGPDAVWVILSDRGSASVQQGTSQSRIDENCVLVLTNLQTLPITVGESARVIALLLPRGAKDLPPSSSGLILTVCRGATSGLLAHVIRGLAEDDHGGFKRHSQRVCDQLSGILRMTCLEETSGGRADVFALFTDATEAIEGRLWDESIDAESLAVRLNVSTRTLHRAFRTQNTTISTWIRERRLERCRDDLLDPMYRHLPVSTVAAQWGLRDAAHFSRLFKARFGTSPRNYRAVAPDTTHAASQRPAPSADRIFA
jgi:AraC-like DNA-binding protein